MSKSSCSALSLHHLLRNGDEGLGQAQGSTGRIVVLLVDMRRDWTTIFSILGGCGSDDSQAERLSISSVVDSPDCTVTKYQFLCILIYLTRGPRCAVVF
jgi:hypothetical protein